MTEREIFVEALSRASGPDRAAFLDTVCGGAAGRTRVELLLAMHESADTVLERSPADLILGDRDAPGDPPDDPLAVLRPFLQPSPNPDAVGRLGRYDVLRVLGQGGFGVVLKAFDDALHRVVAVKVLHPYLAATAAPRKRFVREARAAAPIRDDAVVRIFDVVDEPLPHLVMEFVDGRTLAEYLRENGPLDPAEAAAVGRQAALGLAAAHARGLVHRDVKPSNLMIEAGPGRQVKLTDFGLARAADDLSLSRTGVIAGTPHYMAPEQVRGEPIDHRADLFSLGSVLYEMLTGRPPFQAPTAPAVYRRVTDDAPRPVRELAPGVPAGLCAVVARLHQKDPARRYASAREVADALARCLTEPDRPRLTRRRAAAVLVLGLVAVAAALRLGGFPGTAAPSADPQPAPSVAANPPAATDDAAWEAATAKLPAAEQVEAVRARLKAQNPGFDETGMSAREEAGVVTGVSCVDTNQLSDLRGLRGFPRLREVDLTGYGVRDLSPLRGMKLVRLSSNSNPIENLRPLAGMPLESLGIWGSSCTDLSPLRGMRLRELNCGGSGALGDLSPLRGMPIRALCINGTPVADLSPLRGMPLASLEASRILATDLSALAESPLERLTLNGTPVANFAPLRGVPLRKILLDYNPARHADTLRAIRTLQTVNGRPAAEVLAGRE